MKQPAREFFDEKIRKIAEKEGNADSRIFARPDISAAVASGGIKKVHICGVCGKGTSSLAGLFAEAGFEVSGSDEGCYPPASDLIERLGIKFYEGFSENHVKDKDLIVVANMFGPANIEVAYARENKLGQMSLPEAITEFFIKDKTSIVITGTHGKTTTTGLLAHVFLTAGRDPGFVVGGTAVPTKTGIGETSFNVGAKGQRNIANINSASSGANNKGYFVVEGDEYDTAYFDKSPKFLHYKPNIGVITSLEFDHVDIYANFEEYKQSFVFLAEELPENALLVLNGDSEEVIKMAAYSAAPVLYYGLGQNLEQDEGNKNNQNDKNLDVTAKDISTDEKGQHFTLVYKGQNMGNFSIKLFGKYNLANTLAVAAIALHEGLTAEELREGLATFLGMKRRQEIRAVINGVTIIDDFAHHPTAVRETLAGIREHFPAPANRIIALFEPRSNTSRRKMFEHEYGKSFISADALYLSMPALRHNDKPEDFIDGNTVIADAIANATNLAKTAENKGFYGICVSNGDEALAKLVPELKAGDVVVIMSNGSFDGVHEKLISKLRN